MPPAPPFPVETRDDAAGSLVGTQGGHSDVGRRRFGTPTARTALEYVTVVELTIEHSGDSGYVAQ